ncbi:MAG TPA: CinA family protein [Caldisericia bacterium]|jgi:nicotinamide-nucleotide amidase|nr:CinA family protein [Caldisericia bacterium]HXK51167.1 CinA family protein [Caldisericia bacterium]
MTDNEKLYSITEKVVLFLLQKHLTLSVAESITGGLFSSTLTDVPGCSEVLMEGIVSYTIASKVTRLGISQDCLQKHGVISSFTAKIMAKNVKKLLQTDYGISFTGNAGPGVNETGSQVGTVFIGISNPNGTVVCKECNFSSTLHRKEIKYQTVLTGIEFLWDQIQKYHKIR